MGNFLEDAITVKSSGKNGGLMRGWWMVSGVYAEGGGPSMIFFVPQLRYD